MIMSAYIVEDKTINKIVSWFQRERHSMEGSLEFIARKHNINLISDMWDERKLATEMFALNCAGVDARYGLGTAKGEVIKPFEYKPEYNKPLVEVFKALQCWLYQCSEGDVPETKLYQFFSDVENYLAQKIVMAMPEYDKAQWG